MKGNSNLKMSVIQRNTSKTISIILLLQLTIYSWKRLKEKLGRT